MKRIVLACSTSNLNNVDKPTNIHVLPMKIIIDGETFLDGESIVSNELAQMMVENPDLEVSTQPISTKEIADVFQGLIKLGFEDVFIVAPSKHQSSVYANLVEVAELYGVLLNIRVFDSKVISYMEGLVALEAAKLIEKDMSFEDMEETLSDFIDRYENWFVINDLRRMIKTNRISAPKAFLANMLQIKPLLRFNRIGVVEPVEQIRSSKKAIERLCSRAEEAMRYKTGRLFIVHNGNDQLAYDIINVLLKKGFVNIPIILNSCSSIVYLGTDGVGIGLIYDE